MFSASAIVKLVLAFTAVSSVAGGGYLFRDKLVNNSFGIETKKPSQSEAPDVTGTGSSASSGTEQNSNGPQASTSTSQEGAAGTQGNTQTSSTGDGQPENKDPQQKSEEQGVVGAFWRAFQRLPI
ncbi:hypothetical protein MSUIS_00840 [Mycoplasma suis KI3806]|uniref:Uncharacterized protein n=1 Tax=Mycoplasma suis (strain KI_3806) TaxID=708248 RepID=F0V2V5_MYCS3|nr:hypothetical protein [Mycoplasma suis]CBZ40177.1 hypothetical protein MSUIS_00840 [Mycoplasma suis KI3806]